MYNQKTAFMGAFIGDYQGSVFEFHYSGDFSFSFDNKKCRLTDDSMMTFAVMDLLTDKGETFTDDDVLFFFKKWYAKNPFAGYGDNFRRFLCGVSTRNDSYGDGAPMRISPVGHFAKNEKEAIDLSLRITRISHDHPESYRAAILLSRLIYFARHGADKRQLKEIASREYRLFASLEAIREDNHFSSCVDASCMKNMPQALSFFFLTNSFDECLRASVSSGGDCDTNAAIACSLAEVFYKESLINHKLRVLDYVIAKNDKDMMRLLTDEKVIAKFH